MNSRNSLVLSILLAFSQCSGTAFEGLKIPKGMKATIVSQGYKRQIGIRKPVKVKTAEENILPPKRLIATKRVKQKQQVARVKGHTNLANTNHMAVVLKNSGYRLHKKRTLKNEDRWVYWLKDRAGKPLYKVELTWDQPRGSVAELEIWSWDDKNRFDLEGREALVALFGRLLTN